MKKVMKTEWIIQKNKRSNYIFCAIFLLFVILCISIIRKEHECIVEALDMNKYYTYAISPVMNAMLLFSLLFLDTFFIFLGFFTARYDEQEYCFLHRTTTFASEKIVISQYIFFFVTLCLYMLIILIVGIILHYTLEMNGGGHYMLVAEKCGMIFMEKILCVYIMVYFSYSIGRIISCLVPHKTVGIILCLVFDQILLVKSWLTTALVNRVFADSQYYVSTGDTISFQNVNIGVIWLGVIIAAGIVWIVMMNLTKWRFRNAG